MVMQKRLAGKSGFAQVSQVMFCWKFVYIVRFAKRKFGLGLQGFYLFACVNSQSFASRLSLLINKNVLFCEFSLAI